MSTRWIEIGIAFLVVSPASPLALRHLETNQQPLPPAPNHRSGDGAKQAVVPPAASRQVPAPSPATPPPSLDYRIGPDDLLAVSVLEAPELNGSLRVSTSGQVTVGLAGVQDVAGLTVREVETLLSEKLRKFIRNPHVTVHVAEMRSHSVSVIGAVRKPGVIQVTSTKTLLEVISLAEGLAVDAGEFAVVVRGQAHASSQASAQQSGQTGSEQSMQIKLRDLMESGDPNLNVPVYPGDVVKITQAGMIYVVGEINQPGSYVLPNNGKITVLQALALGKGFTPTADKDSSVIVRTDGAGKRTEIPVDLEKILKGKQPEITLEARDVLFVPNSRAKSFGRGAIDALVRMARPF